MSKSPKKEDSKTKKGLGRGLGDLLAEHDTDLPFLGAYGAVSESYEEGLPGSFSQDDPNELLKAFERHIRSIFEGELSIEDDSISIKDYFSVSISEDSGVNLVISGEHLPFVPSDLSSPSFVGGNLSEDRSSAEVSVIQWGIEARRLISRICEHYTLIH